MVNIKRTDWFVRCIAEGDSALNAEAIGRLSDQLGIHFSNRGYFCVAMRFAGNLRMTDDAQYPVLLLRACGSASRYLPSDAYSYIGEGLCVVMLICGEECERSATVERLHRQLLKACGKPIQLGVGRSYTDLSMLSHSRVEAYEALDSIGCAATVSYIDDIYVMRSMTTGKLDSEKRQVVELFKSGKLDEMMEKMTVLAEIVRSESPVREGMPYPTSIRRTILELLVQIMHISADAGVDVDALLGYQDPYTKVFAFTGTPLILAWFAEVAQKLYHSICDLSSRNQNNMLAKAMQCIEAHIADPELSLSLVSDALSITPTYFSAFFIREVGTGFNEYITGMRIDRAKKLLTVTNRRISDIAFECGFRSPSYFNSVFRKHLGMSPGEYRNTK